MAKGDLTLSPQERTRLTRSRILEVATRLFAEKGYHGTSMDDLQRATGLKRGGLYHHMGAKESILYEICETRISQAIDDAHRVLGAHRDPQVRIRELARVRLEDIARHKEAWIVIQRDSRSLSSERRSELRAKRNTLTETWTESLKGVTGVPENEDIDSVFTMAILGMFDYAALWIGQDGPKSPQEIADHFVDIILLGLEKAMLR